MRILKDCCPQGGSLTTRVNQGKAEKTTRPVVQKDLVHVPERVRDPGMERFMDSGHGLKGGSTPRGVGWPPRGPFEDPAWVCFRGPLLAA